MNLTHVVVSEAERVAEQLSVSNLETAVRAVRDSGCVVLDDAVERDHLTQLRKVMTDNSRWLLRGAAIAPSLFWSANGARAGHLQQSIPRGGELVFRDVVCNPLANQVTSALLGRDAFFDFPTYNCNVNCPGSVDQAVHFDTAPPGTLAVNIALRDVTEADGAIELWLGTHVDPGESFTVPEDVLQRRRAVMEPIRGTTRLGSLMIRDLALWHRGRANPSQDLRHMIAILHYRAGAQTHPYYFNARPTRFALECKDVFRNSPVRPNIAFTRLPLLNLLAGPATEIAKAITSHPATTKLRRGFRKATRLAIRR